MFKEKNDEIWLSALTKSSTATENQKAKCSITQRLRIYLGRSDVVTTSTKLVFNLVNGSNLPPPRNSRAIKIIHIYNFVNNPPYRDLEPSANQNQRQNHVISHRNCFLTQAYTNKILSRAQVPGETRRFLFACTWFCPIWDLHLF